MGTQLAEAENTRRVYRDHLSECCAKCLVTPLDISSSGGWHTTRNGVTLARPICGGGGDGAPEACVFACMRGTST